MGCEDRRMKGWGVKTWEHEGWGVKVWWCKGVGCEDIRVRVKRNDTGGLVVGAQEK